MKGGFVCAPGKKKENGTCISLQDLQKIGVNINMTSGKNIIKINNNKADLYKSIINVLGCTDDMCVINSKQILAMNDAEITQYTLRHPGPKDKKWLSTLDINRVLDQYNHVYKSFMFLGAVPIDFAELPFLGISNINLYKLEQKGIHKIAVVFNLDEHYKSGSHWVALYSDLKKKQVYFFDSNGTRPEPRIANFMRYIVKYLIVRHNIPEDEILDINNELVTFNSIQHQFKNSECGVYSINFIIRMLQGSSFRSIILDRMSDDAMQLCRQVYFS